MTFPKILYVFNLISIDILYKTFQPFISSTQVFTKKLVTKIPIYCKTNIFICYVEKIHWKILRNKYIKKLKNKLINTTLLHFPLLLLVEQVVNLNSFKFIIEIKSLNKKKTYRHIHFTPILLNRQKNWLFREISIAGADYVKLAIWML